MANMRRRINRRGQRRRRAARTIALAMSSTLPRVVGAPQTIAMTMSSTPASPAMASVPSAASAAAAPLATFLAALSASIDDATFESLVLSKNRAAAGEPKSIRVRPIVLKGERVLSFVAVHSSRDLTTNLRLDDGIAAVAAFLDPTRTPAFAHATLHTAAADTQLLVSKKGKATLRRHDRSPDAVGETAPSEGEAGAHDRARRRRLPLDLPFWPELGITDGGQRLVPSMTRKWR